MGRWGRAEFGEFRRFAEQFKALDVDALCVACAKELAARLLALVIPVTPVGKYPKSSGKKGGTLRRGWGAKSGKDAAGYAQSLTVTKTGEEYRIEIINPVEYASYVEFGHRTVNGGWAEGRYMLTISEEKLRRIAPGVLEKKLLQALRKVCNGGN